MTLQQLQYIVALDNHRHFVKAAESCNVAQPTLTIQVKKLEDQMSVQLFDRSKHPLRPTPIGELFIAKARSILREISELKELVNDERERMDGVYHLGIIPTLSPYLLPLFIGDFMRQFPDTRLVFNELQSSEIIERLNKGTLDIGVLVTPLDEQGLREIPVFYEPFLLFSNEENELLQHELIDPNALKEDELWLLGQGHCFRNQTMNICHVTGGDSKRNLLMEGGSIETIKKMLREVPGYTLIPELSFDRHQDASVVRRFTDPEPVREVSIVVHKTFTRERLITELRRSIIDHIPDTFQRNDRYFMVKWR